MGELWIWIRVPLRALDRAIDALKERVARGHVEASQIDDDAKAKRRRTEADTDDTDAETLKRAVRSLDEPRD